MESNLRILTLVLTGILICSAFLFVTTSQLNVVGSEEERDLPYESSSTYAKASIYVDPLNVEVHAGDFVTIQVKIENVSNLYGLDVKLSWDPSIITYINHTVCIPVEDYPNGVMHKPIMMLRNVVSETWLPDTPPGTLCCITFVCVNPAPSFDGNGTILNMTFQALKAGGCSIRFTEVELASKQATAIPNSPVNGYVTVVSFEHDLSVHLEAQPHVLPGAVTVLKGTVYNVGLHAEDAINLTLLIDDILINELVNASLEPNTSSSIFYEWSPNAEKVYNITLIASSVFSEAHLQNNRITKNVLVSYVIKVPLDSLTIKRALDMASPGATIHVAAGIYYEQLVITKPLRLIGEEDSIIDGQGNNIVVQIEADRTIIEKFQIRNGYMMGICVNRAAHVTIVHCHINLVMDTGIWLYNTKNTTIMFNNIEGCRTGLGMMTSPFSNYSTIVGNTFLNNRDVGFRIYGVGHIICHNNFINTSLWLPVLATWDNGEGEGNYWSNYTGEDLNGDGVGDTMLPHQEVDYFPLMRPWTLDLITDASLD